MKSPIRRCLVLLLLLALATPLVWGNGLLFPYVIPKAFFFQAVVGLALLVTTLSWIAGMDDLPRTGDLPSNWLRDPVVWALAALVVVGGVSALFGDAPSRSLLGTLERRWGVLAWATFGAFYALARYGLDGVGWKRALGVCVAVATAASLYGLARAAGVWPGQSEPVAWDRMASTLGNPGYLAAYLTVSLSLTGFLVARTRRTGMRLLLLAAGCVQLAAILLTGTRSIVVGAGLALVLLVGAWLATAPDRRTRWIVGGIVALSLAAVAAVALMGEGGSHVTTWVDRLASMSPETRSARIRLLVWQSALEGIREAPILGVGPENFHLVWSRHFDPLIYNIGNSPVFDRAHNVLVGTATTTGLLGLLAYLAIWGALGRSMLRAVRRSTLSPVEASILAFGAIAYLGHLLFWFEDLSSFLVFVVLAGLVGHLAAAGRIPDGSSRSAEGSSGGRSRRDPESSGEEDTGEAAAGADGAGGGTGGGSPQRRVLRLWLSSLLLVGLSGVLAWHNVRVLDAARHTWDGEYSMNAWEGAERYQAALASGLPGSGPIIEAYLRRLTFLAGHGDDGGPESATERMRSALAAAQSALDGWRARDPTNPRVHVQRSRLCGIRQDVQGGSAGRRCAAESLRRAIELAPRRIRYRHLLAEHHLTTGEPERALQVLQEALQIYGSFGETYYYLARVHHQTGDMGEAVRQALIAVSLGYDGQPEPFVLELADWLAADGRFAEAAELLESHLALRYRRLARPDLASPPGKGFRPWDLPLASRLPLLHWRADDPEAAIRTALFLSHRLARREDYPSAPRDARIRQFVRDVQADRIERWEGEREVLKGRAGGSSPPPARTGSDDSGGTTPSDESGMSSRTDDPMDDHHDGDDTTGSSEGPIGSQADGFHPPGAPDRADDPGPRGGDRHARHPSVPRSHRPAESRIRLPGQAVPGADAGHRPSRRRSNSGLRRRATDPGGPGRPHREPDRPAGRPLPGGLGPTPPLDAALQQPGPGGTGKPVSLPRRTGDSDRQQLPGTAADRAVQDPVARRDAALFSTSMHGLREMATHVKVKALCVNMIA